MRQHCTPIRMATIKSGDNSNADEDAEKLNHSLFAGWNVKWHSLSGKWFGSF